MRVITMIRLACKCCCLAVFYPMVVRGGGHVDVAEHLCFCIMVVKGCGQDQVLLSMCVLASI